MDVSRLEAGIIVNGLSFINVGFDIDAKNCRIKLSKVSFEPGTSIRERQLFFYVFIILFKHHFRFEQGPEGCVTYGGKFLFKDVSRVGTGALYSGGGRLQP